MRFADFATQKFPPDIYAELKNEPPKHIKGALMFFNADKISELLDAGNTKAEIDRMWSDLIAAAVLHKVELPPHAKRVAKRLGFSV